MSPKLQREWAFAIIEVGLPDETFWKLTPVEFAALVEAWRAKSGRLIDFENRKVARLCAVMANTVRDPKKKPSPWTEEDFMPKSKEQIEAESLQSWESQMAILGGIGVREKTNGN